MLAVQGELRLTASKSTICDPCTRDDDQYHSYLDVERAGLVTCARTCGSPDIFVGRTRRTADSTPLTLHGWTTVRITSRSPSTHQGGYCPRWAGRWPSGSDVTRYPGHKRAGPLWRLKRADLRRHRRKEDWPSLVARSTMATSRSTTTSPLCSSCKMAELQGGRRRLPSNCDHDDAALASTSPRRSVPLDEAAGSYLGSCRSWAEAFDARGGASHAAGVVHWLARTPGRCSVTARRPVRQGARSNAFSRALASVRWCVPTLSQLRCSVALSARPSCRQSARGSCRRVPG